MDQGMGRVTKIKEILQRKMDPYIEEKENGRAVEIENGSPASTPAGVVASPQQSDTTATPKFWFAISERLNLKADKKERQERLTKQAAAREAASRKAKETFMKA